MAKVLSKQGRDGVKAHAPVHRLGSQGMSQLMGGDVADTGHVGDAAQRSRHALVADRSIVFDQKVIGAQPVRSVVGDPVIKQVLELWVQRDIAVVVQLADRDAQPVTFWFQVRPVEAVHQGLSAGNDPRSGAG